METLQAQLIRRNQMKKRLFQDLFLIQLQLENYQDDRCEFHEELKEVINRIDQLMETLMNGPERSI